MPLPAPRAAVGRSVRLLRLAGALAVLLAILAIAGILDGGPTRRSGILIAAAIIVGAGALAGLALAALPFLQRERESDDT